MGDISGVVTVKLDKELKRRLVAQAIRRNSSISDLIRESLAQYLEREFARDELEKLMGVISTTNRT